MLISPRLAALSTILASPASARSFKPEAPTPAIRAKIMEKAKLLTPEESRNLREQNDRALSNSYSDYYATSSTFSNAFGFNPTMFSLSYSRCAQVRQFDDQVAAREDTKSVFTTKHFAIFRFCPTKSCDPYAITPSEEQEEDDQTNSAWYNPYASDSESGEESYMGMDWETYQAYREDKYKQYEYANSDSAKAAADNFAGIKSQFEVGGAAGSGCSSNYGEYMIELEDYLQIMAESINTRFDEYCNYCEKCMYGEYQNWAKNQDNRELFEQHEDGWKNIEFERQLGGCADYDQCRYYANACNNGLDDSITDYFQCTAEGNYYVGPHCAEDGESITLGAYMDAYCDVYAGDVTKLTGTEVDHEALDNWSTGSLNALFPNEGFQEQMYQLYGGWETMCIPCSEASASMFNQVDDETVVNDLCLYLYESSARCDHHYNNYQSKSKSIGLYDKERMELSCNYIDRAVMGNYDESGLLSIPESPLVTYTPQSLKETEYYAAAYPYISKVSGWQIFGLIASLIAVIALSAWSIKLHRSLTKKGQWRPIRRNKKSALAQPADITRLDSGIGMARQQSGSSYYMT